MPDSLIPPAGSRIPDEITIGIVNLMPPAGMRGIEAQFKNLLPDAHAGTRIALRRFALAPAADHEPLDALWPARVDGLIVTGTQPQAIDIPDEPCWPALARLVDWAAGHASSVIWSCLAAQAAVFAVSGIARRKLPQKLSGIYMAETVAAHRLTALLPRHWPVPHSRYNTLDEAPLRDHGYTILSRGPDIGADTFIKQHGESLFVLFQGHPEYLPATLPGEYLRDIRRYLSGQSETYPEIPEHCLSPAAIADFEALRDSALKTRDPSLADRLTAPEPPAFTWRNPAQSLYDGWLAYLIAAAARRLPAG